MEFVFKTQLIIVGVIMDWLSRLDPNTAAGMLTVLLTVGTFLYHKIRGDKNENWSDALGGIGRQALSTLLADPTLSEENLQSRAIELVWSLAAKAHVPIPRNAATEALANPIISHLVADALEQLKMRTNIPAQLNEIAARSQSILDTIKNFKPQGAFEREVSYSGEVK